ncbi:MAG: YggT family protein [Candidatus Poribacteria bacterium]|nr:YggT family protein [Candidatus Poribacteria bacterium]
MDGNALQSVSYLLRLALNAYSMMILGSVVLSWFTLGGTNHPSIQRAQEFLDRWTDPYLAPLRQLMSPISMRIGLDFSPLVGLLILNFIASRLP